MIPIDQFKAVEIRIGEILSVEKVEGADKLFRLQVSFGARPAAPGMPVEIPTGPVLAPAVEQEVRQIVSGIAPYFPDPSVLVGVKCAFATNLEPRTIRGLESNGMIMAAGGGDEPFTLLFAAKDAAPGSLVR